MPAPTPQFTIAKPTGGVLPIANVTGEANIQADAPAKTLQSKLKVVVRRLPPGLTKLEFEDALGDEWKLGNGKVSWVEYKPGKVSKE